MQTSILKVGQPIAVAGQIVDNSGVIDVLSRFSEETVNQIGFGCGLQLGVTRIQQLLTPGTATTIAPPRSIPGRVCDAVARWGFGRRGYRQPGA